MPGTISPTLWGQSEPQPRYVWVACSIRPAPGHARQVAPHRVNDPLDEILCEVCREPQREMSNTAIERYKRGDRRCFHCRVDEHQLCNGVACYDCPREFHRRVGQPTTRTS